MMLHPLLHRLLIVSLLAFGLHSVSPALATPGAVAPLAPAAPGELDSTFGGFGAGGYVTLPGFSVADFVRQPDGKIVVVGTTPQYYELVVYRFLPNGQPDPAFGGGDGLVDLADVLSARSVAVRADGKIVVGGHPTPSAGPGFGLVRLSTDGALDLTFGASGVYTDTSHYLYSLEDVVVQPDGKIVVVGRANLLDDTYFVVARYLPNGFRDVFFGDGEGDEFIRFGGNDHAFAVALQPNGKLVIVGTADGSALGAARVNSDGTLDDNSDGDGGFGDDGQLTINFEGDATAYAVQVMPDGRLVVVGHNSTGTSFLARFEPDGDLDPTFNGTSLQPYTNDFLTDVALLPDGRVLALGTHGNDFALHRVTVDGQEDETFGFNNGVVFPDFGGLEQGRRLALLPDGRLLVAGTRGGSTVLFQLWPSGITFDTGGQQTHALNVGDVYPAGSDEFAQGLVRQPDGRLLVAGEVRTALGDRSLATVTRFLPTGQVDTSFGIRGTAFTAAGDFNLAAALAVQPDGKVVIAGFTTGNGGIGHDLLIARLDAHGNEDTTFNGGKGYVRVDFGSGHDKLYALALTPPDPDTGQVKIVVAGIAYNGAYDVWVVMRLTADGLPDPSFGPDENGLAFLNFSDTCEKCMVAAHAVAVQPDGRVVVAGHVGFDTALARLTAGGLPDPTFGTEGVTLTNLGGSDAINALVLAPDGQLFGAGSHDFGGHNNFLVTHFGASGVLLAHGSVDWGGGNDVAYALDWRDDGQLAAGGMSDGKMAWAQFSAADVTASPLTATTDFVGTFEPGTGIQFTDDDQVIVAGWQEYQGDWNIGLARFETTPETVVQPPVPGTFRLFLPVVVR